MYDCVRNALKKTGTDPKSIDILVINCSLFSPTPSLCSMVSFILYFSFHEFHWILVSSIQYFRDLCFYSFYSSIVDVIRTYVRAGMYVWHVHSPISNLFRFVFISIILNYHFDILLLKQKLNFLLMFIHVNFCSLTEYLLCVCRLLMNLGCARMWVRTISVAWYVRSQHFLFY